MAKADGLDHPPDGQPSATAVRFPHVSRGITIDSWEKLYNVGSIGHLTLESLFDLYG